MVCKVCNQDNKPLFNAKILYKYNVNYYHCSNCGFLQTEEPYWLNEAYDQSINITDTGILSRNLYLSRITSQIIELFFDMNKKFIDYAGGYGIFTRLMRDNGFDFFWQDKYSKNLVARGFECIETDKPYELLTAFEVFEHLVNPLDEISKIIEYSDNIMFSTYLINEHNFLDQSWWYYAFEHGQHISFYSKNTLEFIAKKNNLNLYTNSVNIHLMTKKKINNFLLKLFFFFYKLKSYSSHMYKSKSKTVSDMHLLINKESKE